MRELPRNKKVLVVCAHPDDDTFCMAASILKMVEGGCDVTCLFLTTSPRAVLGGMPISEKEQIRISEGTAACRVIGAVPEFLNIEKEELESPKAMDVILSRARKHSPDVIFSLPGNDGHPTHRKASRISEHLARELGHEEIWLYESWTLLSSPNVIYFFGEEQMALKKKAMRKHRSQLERQGPTDEAFVCLNRFRAIMIREPLRGFGEKHTEMGRYAEAFEVKKLGDG